MLKHNIVRYKLIEAHLNAVKKGKLEVGNRLLRLLRKGEIRIGLADDAGFEAETIAQDCGCRIRYSRCYGSAHIRF